MMTQAANSPLTSAKTLVLGLSRIHSTLEVAVGGFFLCRASSSSIFLAYSRPRRKLGLQCLTSLSRLKTVECTAIVVFVPFEDQSPQIFHMMQQKMMGFSDCYTRVQLSGWVVTGRFSSIR